LNEAELSSNGHVHCLLNFRRNPLIHLLGLSSAVLYILLAWLSFHPARLSVPMYLSIMSVLWVFFGLGYRQEKLSIQTLIFWSVCFRCIGLFAEPLFEDDHYRFLWDGYTFSRFGSPYGIPPAAFFSDLEVPFVFQRVLDNINYPDVPTIYGPVLEIVFLACYLVKAASLLPLKLILVAADFGVIGILSKRISPQHLLLYAWCPNLIRETAFTAHPETLGIFFLLAALNAKTSAEHKLPFLTALAIGVKMTAFVAAPFLFWPVRLRQISYFLLALLAVYLPVLLSGTSDLETLRMFLSQWEYNSSLFAMLTSLGFSRPTSQVIGAGVVLAVALPLFLHWRRDPKRFPRLDLLFFVFFLCSPVFNPWYALWMLPFMAMYPSITLFTALFLLNLSYYNGMNVPSLGLLPYEHPTWLRWVEFGSIGPIALLEGWYRWNKRTKIAGRHF
jgi:alpha-1,6-mannosyltransferase